MTYNFTIGKIIEQEMSAGIVDNLSVLFGSKISGKVLAIFVVIALLHDIY